MPRPMAAQLRTLDSRSLMATALTRYRPTLVVSRAISLMRNVLIPMEATRSKKLV